MWAYNIQVHNITYIGWDGGRAVDALLTEDNPKIHTQVRLVCKCGADQWKNFVVKVKKNGYKKNVKYVHRTKMSS